MVFPVLDRTVTDEDDQARGADAQGDLSLGDLAFTIRWLLDDLDPAVAGGIRRTPALLVLLDRIWWERRYRRLAGPVCRVSAS